MIVDMVRGNIFESEHNNIAFAVNTEGFNDSGFAGKVSQNYWQDLAITGTKELGDYLQEEVEGKKFFALVAHSLNNGWEQTPEAVTKALDNIPLDKNETIACVMMGGGMIGSIQGADLFAILGGIARSSKKVVVYTL